MGDNSIQVGGGSMFPIAPDSTPASLIHADPAAVAAAEMAKSKIQLAYFMATQQPRNQRDAWQRIMESCKRPAFAEKAIYAKPVGGGSKVEGPSIRLAEEIIRSWRNIMVLTQVVYEDDRARRVSVQVIDLESNNQYLREIVTPKTVERKNAKDRDVIGERMNSQGERVFIVRATEDEMSNREAAQISKAVRNEGLRLVPADIVEDAMSEAKATRRQKTAADPAHAIKSLVYRFGEVRVPVAELERYLACSVDMATVDQIDDLEGILQAIRDRETTWSAVMEQRHASDPNATAKEATDSRAAALREQMAKAKGTGEAATSGATDGGKSERPAAPVPEEKKAAPAPKAIDDLANVPPSSDLADDPDRQVAAVGYAVVDLVDMTIDELVGHANRVIKKMEVGEKRTARTASEANSESGLIAVLTKVARREAGKN
jgi:hypothetical protein